MVLLPQDSGPAANTGPLDWLVDRQMTGYTTDGRGLTLHFGRRRLVLSPGEGIFVEIDDPEATS